MLATPATTPRTLTGWQLTDRNNRATTVNVTIPAGGTEPIGLNGSGIQLGNDRGNLVLHDQHGATIDSVVYGNADAHPEGRYVRRQASRSSA